MILAQYTRQQHTAAFTVQTKLREMQDSWLRKKSEEIQSIADKQDMSSEATTLLSADRSMLLTDKKTILERWTEHFSSVYNRPSSIDKDAIDSLPQIACNFCQMNFQPSWIQRK